MKILHHSEFSEENRTAVGPFLSKTALLHSKVHHRCDALDEAGLNETAELLSRLADRLMRQEKLLIEERRRSAALELQLASNHS